MEIRDATALNLLSTLQSTEVVRFTDGLAYSPDGCSLAYCSNTAIVIWDTQTGGEVGKIEHGSAGNSLELVWSLDGTMISTLSLPVSGTHTVRVYEVTSGVMRSPGTVQSIGGEHLWAHDKSFRVMTMTKDHQGSTINIYEVGSALTKVEQFPFRSYPALGVFSPATYRISVTVARDRNRDPELLISNVRDSEVLLHEPGFYHYVNFSPDGNLVAAFTGDHLLVWRYAPGCYTRWREFQQTPTSLQFSPTSSSILGRADALLHVLHLDHSPTNLTAKSVAAAHGIPRDAYSPHGAYIATTRRGESAITITNLRSQHPTPSQFIDTDLEISAMVLTGNVLLVKDSNTIVAWLLTEEGVVVGLFDRKRASRNDSLWEAPFRAHTSFWAKLLQREGGGDDGDDALEFSVEGEIASVGHNGDSIRVYHTITGEILGLDEAPLNTGYRFDGPRRDDCDIYRRDLRKQHGPLEYDWPVSPNTLREGWVKDPEGKHRLWLRPRWRSAGNDVDWLDQVTTLRLKNSSELVIVKF